MSALLTMPDTEEQLLRMLSRQAEELRSEIAKKQTELEQIEDLIATKTQPWAGKKLQDAIIELLREYGHAVHEDTLVDELVRRGVSRKTKTPGANIRKSILVLIDVGTVARSKDGKLSLK